MKSMWHGQIATWLERSETGDFKFRDNSLKSLFLVHHYVQIVEVDDYGCSCCVTQTFWLPISTPIIYEDQKVLTMGVDVCAYDIPQSVWDDV